MTDRLPFLAIRAFATVSTFGSFRRAAQELNVTTGAVSQQVKMLETFLGTRLLIRKGTTIELTPSGVQLFASTMEPLLALERACEAIRPKNVRSTLRVSALGSFAINWLVPRLQRFHSVHPEIEVRIETTGRLVDLANEPIDVALRYGGGSYCSLHAQLFLKPSLTVVASPALLQDMPIITADDCLKHTLLQDNLRFDWPYWLRSHGVPVREFSKAPSFEDDLLLVQAACARHGLAVIRTIYGRAEIKAGMLVEPFDPIISQRGYYFVCRPPLLRERRTKLFLDWLLSEGSASTPSH